MKKSLLLGAFLAFTPVALLLPGCSGGTSGLGSIFPTPTPIPVSVNQTSNFTLSNGQRAILQTVRSGNALTGTIQIFAPVTPLTAKREAAALTTSIKVGTFSITGTFTPERAFNITVRDGNTVLFTMSGLFATATQPGSYNLTFGNQTDSGSIPNATPTAVPSSSATPAATATTSATPRPSGTPAATPRPSGTPAATPRPSGTPVPSPTPGVSRLESISFTNGAGFNGFGVNTNVPLLGQTPTFSNATQFSASNIQLGGDNNLLFEGPVLNRPARAGDTFALGNMVAATGILYYSEASNGGTKEWVSTSGTFRVTSVSAKSVNFSLENVAFRAQASNPAAGTFTLSGRGIFNGS